MRYRAISKSDVEDAIRKPDVKFVTDRSRFASLKRHGNKFLKVIYERRNDKITVVTVYWTRRLRRQ